MKFKEGKVIEKFYVEKGGKQMQALVRYPKKTDVKVGTRYINSLIDKRTMIGFSKKTTLEKENKWLKDTLENMRKGESIVLFVEINGKMIAAGNVTKARFDEEKHVCELGISVSKLCRGLGLGKKISELLIDSAKKYLGAGIVTLVVYSGNKPAINLYKSLGFVQAGKIPRGFKHGERYHDKIMMYKVLK